MHKVIIPVGKIALNCVMERFKIAIAGLGHVARYQIEAILQTSSLELCAGFDINLLKASLLPDSATFYPFLEDMIENSGAEIVVVATPNKSHFEMIKLIVKKGLSVLVEKPMVSSAEQLKELVFLQKKHGAKSIYAAFHSAYALDLSWWLEHSAAIINEYRLGNLQAFSQSFFDPYVFDGKVLNRAKSLDNAWADSGINALSVLDRILDINNLSVETVRTNKADNEKDLITQGLATFKLGGKPVVIDCDWGLGVNQKTTTIYFENGDIVLDHSKERVTLVQNGREMQLKCLKNKNSRLLNHYLALFSEFALNYAMGTSNFEDACRIHDKYFEVMEFGRS